MNGKKDDKKMSEKQAQKVQQSYKLPSCNR